MSDIDLLESLVGICTFPVNYLRVTQGDVCDPCAARVRSDCSEVELVSRTRTDDN